MSSPQERSKRLMEALRSRHHESFEKSLGRAVRQAGGSFAEYVAIITEVRDYARVHKVDLRDAARALAHQS